MPPKEPEQLRQDFAELGLPFGAGAEECKAAYRRLLKLHHPDRHAGHQGNMEKATKKMAKINAAYDRIEKWRGEGKG
ncbi:MAG: J domain-containing protein [Treponema sp.]|jgi:curved DNA-binding protein CbpA|nr:J domain-containing protein [Treponema sp.]